VTEKLLMNVSNPTVEKALAPLMLSPTREAWRAIANQAVESLAPKWQTQVVASYQQSLQGKFPFSMSGEDADLQDVSQFLNPQQGVLWQFVHASLSPYIQLENGQWKAKTWLGVGASFAPGFLKALTQAQHISQAFFAQGEAAPGFSIDVYPYPIPNISEISLNTSGDTYHYNNGPQQWRRIKWTAVNFNDDTQLNVMSSTGENISTQDYTGTWGLFHLLASAKLTPETNNTYQAIWRLNGPEGKTIHVRLLFKDEGQNNILGLLTHPFYLPKQLTTQNNA